MNIFLIAAVISVIYVIIKFIEMRILDKDEDPVPLKFLVRDALLVFCSVVVGNLVIEQFGTIIEAHGGGDAPPETPKVFTDNPDF